MEERFEFHQAILWEQFSLAEQEMNIATTAQKLFNQSYTDVIQLAALIMVLNHKCWYWYEYNNQILSDLYSELYYKYNDKAWNWLESNGTEEEKNWFFHALD